MFGASRDFDNGTNYESQSSAVGPASTKDRENKRIMDYERRREEIERQEREAMNMSAGDNQDYEEPQIMWPTQMERQSQH